MNYLFRYLQLLTEAEVERLETLELAPRARSVLDRLGALRHHPDPARDGVLGELSLSSIHFDKICSILLRQVYRTIVPQEGTALLYDLNRRNLLGNFLHELRRQERELAGSPAERRAEFYLECFNLIGRLSRKDCDERLMRDLARKYERLRPSPDNRIYFEASMIGVRIWSGAAQGINDAIRPAIWRRLVANGRRITEQTGPMAIFKQYKTFALYYLQLDHSPGARLEYLEKAAALGSLHPDLFSREELVLTRCTIAESHYFNSSDFRRAYDLYAAEFEEHADVLARDYYHTTKFVQLCIILGNYRRAADLLEERFSRHVNARMDSLGTMAAISWGKLLLCTGRLDEAKPYIDLGMRLNRKNFYVQYEIELRMLETAYFMLKGEFEFAPRLAEKNIKYLRSKDFTFANSRYYPWYMKLVQSFVDERETGKKLSGELEAKLEEFREGAAAIYGILLRLMRGGNVKESRSRGIFD